MRTNRVVSAGVAAVLVAAIAVGGWYFLLRDDAPPPVNLDDAIASIGTPTATPAGTVTSVSTAETTPSTATTGTATPGGTVDAASPVSSDSTLAGTWSVSSAGESFVGYRVGEELSSVGTQTAVGRTSDITGALQFDGSTITAVDIEANVASLQSDDSRRDRQLRDRGLQTNSFPTASFHLTAPIEVAPLPSEGEPFAAVVAGELTLHGVTRPITIELSGQLVEGLVVVVGSTEIQFADFDIEPPTGFIVLSVDDHGTLEFQVIFQLVR